MTKEFEVPYSAERQAAHFVFGISITRLAKIYGVITYTIKLSVNPGEYRGNSMTPWDKRPDSQRAAAVVKAYGVLLDSGDSPDLSLAAPFLSYIDEENALDLLEHSGISAHSLSVAFSNLFPGKDAKP